MGLSLVHANGLRRMHPRSGRIEHWQLESRLFFDECGTDKRKDYPADQWEMLRTDLYVQAHGIRHSNRKSFIGDLWCRNEVELNPEEIQGAVHIRFPSLFNECWLYVNGEEVAHHKQGQLWWLNDYRFEWDVDLTDKLKAGRNILTLRCNCEHHLGGMFRRPFLYRKTVV